MPVASSDLEWRYSAPAALAGNTVPQTDPSSSYGAFVSQTAWASGNPTGLFGDVTSQANRDRVVEYRCLFLVNKHPTDSMTSTTIFLPSPLPSNTQVAIGVDTIAASPLNDDSPQAQTPLDRFSAPAGISFSAPVVIGSALSLGTIAAGHCKAVWFRRTDIATTINGTDNLDIQVDWT